MIITTIEELRTAAPSHALDSIDGLASFIDNSEHDFLQEKLGQPLYQALCEQYAAHGQGYSHVEEPSTGYFNRLLLMCQRVVAFDALGRAAGSQAISLNDMGINVATADEYAAATDKSIDRFVATCVKESHASLNRLLQTLEQWTQETKADSDDQDEEQKEIVNLWRKSRYFYLAAGMIVPSATVLQDYWNFYENREKFIMMLPDLRYLQEEVVAPAIGEDLCDWLVKQVTTNTDLTDVTKRTIDKLRKTIAAMLEERTQVIKTEKTRRLQAHDESVRLLQSAIDYISAHQSDYPQDVMKSSPLYVKPIQPNPSDEQPAPPDPSKDDGNCKHDKRRQAFLLTPFLH